MSIFTPDRKSMFNGSGRVRVMPSVSFADTPRPEREEIIRPITVSNETDLSNIERGVQSARQLLWRDFYALRNPSEWTQQIQAQQSNASAHGFFFTQSGGLYDLCDEMVDKDTSIARALSLLCSEVLARETTLAIKPSDADDPRAEEIKDWVQENVIEKEYKSFGFLDMLHTMLLGRATHGFSIHETMLEVGADSMVHPTGFIHRHPGQFAFDSMATLYLAEGLMGENRKPLPDYKFCLTRTAAMYGNPYGRSSIFGLRYLFYFKKEALKAWIDFGDKYGTPIAKAQIGKYIQGGQEAISIQSDQSLKTQAEALISGLTRSKGVVLPPGLDLTFEDRGGTGTSPHETLVRWISREMTGYLLGATLHVEQSEDGAGSFAQAKTHMGIGKIAVKPVAAAIGRDVTRTVIAPIVRMNFGEDAPVPQFGVDTDDAIDVKSFLESVDKAVEWGVPATKAQVRETLGIREADAGEEVIEKKKTPSPLFPGFNFGPDAGDEGDADDDDQDGEPDELNADDDGADDGNDAKFSDAKTALRIAARNFQREVKKKPGRWKQFSRTTRKSTGALN